jgi:uridylate kinase
MDSPKYGRVMLKISGEALIGKSDYGIDTKVMDNIANQIKEVVLMGVEIAVVVGGGNFWRGVAASANGMDRDACNSNECHRPSGCPGKKEYFNKGAVIHYNAGNC